MPLISPLLSLRLLHEAHRKSITEARERPRDDNTAANLVTGAFASLPATPTEVLRGFSPGHMLEGAEQLGYTAGDALAKAAKTKTTGALARDVGTKFPFEVLTTLGMAMPGPKRIAGKYVGPKLRPWLHAMEKAQDFPAYRQAINKVSRNLELALNTPSIPVQSSTYLAGPVQADRALLLHNKLKGVPFQGQYTLTTSNPVKVRGNHAGVARDYLWHPLLLRKFKDVLDVPVVFVEPSRMRNAPIPPNRKNTAHGAVYNHSENRIYVNKDHAKQLSTLELQATIQHEISHAQQNMDKGIREIFSVPYDKQLGEINANLSAQHGIPLTPTPKTQNFVLSDFLEASGLTERELFELVQRRKRRLKGVE